MTDSSAGSGDPLALLPDFHRSTRMPLDAVVRLHFEGTVAYQNGFAANVSALGMFVKHPEPPPVGTRLVFEFVLGEERKPVQGAGVVTWLRERYEGPGRPAGVGIRFTELDALSRQHVAEALFEYLEAQLGVDIADHPDVPNLLAAVPHHSPDALEVADVATESEAEPAPATLRDDEEPVTGPAPEPPSEPENAEPRFRLFADEAESAFDAAGTEPTDPSLFAIETPPEEATEAAERSTSLYIDRPRHARARDRGPWAAIGIAVGIAALGFAVWWFVLGPGSVPALPELPGEAPAVSAAPAPPAVRESVAAEEPFESPPSSDQPAAATTPADAGAAGAAAGDEAVVASPAPASPAAPQPTTGPASRVTQIAWDAAPGASVVTLIGDGSFAPGSFRWYEMSGDRPRILLKLLRMTAGYPEPLITVGTAELSGIRVGYHEKPAGNELHVVLDLASAGVEVESVGIESGRLVVRLAAP